MARTSHEVDVLSEVDPRENQPLSSLFEAVGAVLRIVRGGTPS